MTSSKVLFELASWLRYYSPLSSYVAPFHSAPIAAARQLLKLGQVCEGDTVYDLGCGDGRLLTAAAQHPFGARCVGYELHAGLVQEARSLVGTLDLTQKVEIRQADARSADVQHATVIFMYLSSDGNQMLFDALSSQLQARTRLLTLAFPMECLHSKLTASGYAHGLGLFVYTL